MNDRVRLRPLMMLLACTGCSETFVANLDFVDTFVQSPFEQVDVLLVVDNSGSMGPYQTKLGSDFGGFFEFFAEGEVDWNLAVTHTDVRAEDFGRIRGPIVTSESTNPNELFAEVVNVGTDGGGIEAGLAAAAKLIESPREGFPRDDASVSVIFVSDEEDASPGSVASYVNRYFELRGQRARSGFNASALTVTELADCTPDQFRASSRGTRYEEVAALTGGLSANLCVDDFAQIVVDLALTTSTFEDTFLLRTRPNPSTLRVSVDGVELPCEEGAWSYDRVEREGQQLPAILFSAATLPAPAASILVEYQAGSGDPEGFCPDAQP